MATRIQIRRDSATNWELDDPVLQQGELGWDITNKVLKVGDGLTPWTTLAGYIPPITLADILTTGVAEGASVVMEDSAFVGKVLKVGGPGSGVASNDGTMLPKLLIGTETELVNLGILPQGTLVFVTSYAAGQQFRVIDSPSGGTADESNPFWVGAAASSHTHALADIAQSGATTGQVVTWNGTAWAPATPASGGSTEATVVTESGGYFEFDGSQSNHIYHFTNATYIEFNVEVNSITPFPVGGTFQFYYSGAGQMDVQAGAGVTFLGDHTAGFQVVQNKLYSMRKVATDTWFIISH